jgi:type I restriction enzyme, S subunit
MNVPKLRFPEFRDAGEWSDKKLDEIASLYKGKGISKADIDVRGKVPCIRYGELYTIYSEVIETVFSKTSNPPSDLFFSRKNDVIIPASGETKIDIAKASCVMADNVALGGDLNIIRSCHNGVFISYYLNGPKKLAIARIAQGDTVVHLYLSQLQLLEIGLPTADEQQKIADCLSSIDELIIAQTQKLSTLKAHKKGLMQQLFPAEGETLPKMRFPEFQDAGEWENTTLDKAVCYENGKAHENNIVEIGKFIVVNSKFISTDGKVRKYTDEGLCLASTEDVLMVLSDVPNGKAIAKCYLVDFDNLYTVNQRICKLTPNRIIGKMLFYTLNRNPFYLAFDDGVKQTNLRKEDVLGCPILLPSFPEQHKIADCLSSIDELITTQTQKLDTLKTHKKALMQQLFPMVEEASS